MTIPENTVHYLKDYQPPDYVIDTTELHFDLWEDHTDVTATLRIRANYVADGHRPLVLNGDELEFISVSLNEKELNKEAYDVKPLAFTLHQPPMQFSLTIKTRIYPEKNKALMGLYRTKNMYCTQCEPHGFRRMTYYIDRPDVMSIFTTTISADVQQYPVLLSNGNLIEKGHHDNGRHWAKWHDPYKKPSYLFALVAGKLECCSAEFVTVNYREVRLCLFTEAENRDKCEYALYCLQQAMRWDEQVFGLEYDLDTYMIVAADDFNMGAMENKGLNIFNSKYILANSSIATDVDYHDIEKVVAHEYFHNWTGNRVTVRDWFQLSLKEGLTVFRDQEFSAYRWSQAVTRIQDVKLILTQQFAEDASPLAHPVRPESYISMNNFYTRTVYNKGAEVVRMLFRLVGASGFRHGMDLYFTRFDGHAVTTDDFVQALSDANNIDLQQFKLWYSQAGTPLLDVNWKYDAHYQTWTLFVTQSCLPTPGQPEKKPMHIPLALALLDEKGHEMPLNLSGGERAPNKDEFVLNITKEKEQFHFYNIESKPIPSLLRGFSAPVRLQATYTEEELLFLFTHDNDSVARWDAGQQLLIRETKRLLELWHAKQPLELSSLLMEGMRQILLDKYLDPAFIALLLQIPDQIMLATLFEPVDVDGLYNVYRKMCESLARYLHNDLLKVYQQHHTNTAYHVDAFAVARRTLKNMCLRYLGRLNEPRILQIISDQYYETDNMTDRLAALVACNYLNDPLRDTLLNHFAENFKHETLVMDKWFALQAVSELPNTIEKVRQLAHHPQFIPENPNKIYALFMSFAVGNPYHFHQIDGAGYKLIADEVLRVDKFNPMVAARLAHNFNSWGRYDSKRQALMKSELNRILAEPKLSADVYEIVTKSLNNEKK